MIELDSATVTRERGGWVLWLTWVAATCAGVVAMTFLMTAVRSLAERVDPQKIILVLVLLPGIVLLSGVAQECAMRFCLPGEEGWFRRTLLGALVGIPVGLLAGGITGAGLITILRAKPSVVVQKMLPHTQREAR